MKTLNSYSLISVNTPLISNLNMLENIALIKEFHQHKSIFKAEEEAQNYLKKINLDNIATNRIVQCSSIEIFYVMFIRALMTEDDNIVILLPFSIINNLTNIKGFIDNINILNNKNIFILDLYTNESNYKDTLCNIIK